MLALLAGLALAPPGWSASLVLHIADGNGQALSDAVASLFPESGEPASPRPAPRDHVVDQRDETFIPLVEVMSAGDAVIFRNSDRTRHHVYSFSPLGPFDFVLKPTEISAPIRLQKPGVIAVGCNIHDFMINYLYVSESRWAGKTDASGIVQFSDLPPGGYVVRLWHPRLRPGAAQPTQKVTLSGETSSVDVTLPVLPEHHDESDRERY